MANGHNEPVKFTRGDAERLRVIEVDQQTSHAKLDKLIEKIDSFIKVHDEKHDKLNEQIGTNTRFVCIVKRVCIWALSVSGGLGLLATIAKASGWLD